jgi:triosephosphate isomerase
MTNIAPHKKIVIANWKMAVDAASVTTLTRAASEELGKMDGHAGVVLCPPALYLNHVYDIMAGGVTLGAQDAAVPDHPQGAQTGDISPAMLEAAGCHYVILGHSERRARYGETDALVQAKVAAALAAGLTPILCVGETAAERAAGAGADRVRAQLAACLPPTITAPIYLTYEPVWAISGGSTTAASATLDDIAPMVHLMHAAAVAAGVDPGLIRMIYGGSVKESTIGDILTLSQVDGVLVGRASTVASELRGMIRVAAKFYR